MGKAATSSKKARIANRVIEVLEMFDDSRQEITVMDIVRDHRRPQSSTSELLSSLVELGVLHKDAARRTYRLAVRAAMLGSATPAPFVSDGRIALLLERLAASTGSTVTLSALFGTDSQVIAVRRGGSVRTLLKNINSGALEPLTKSISGRLILASVSEQTRHGLLRRMNASFSERDWFSVTAMMQEIAELVDKPHAFGPADHETGLEALCALVPRQQAGSPLVITLFPPDRPMSQETMLANLRHAMRTCLPDAGEHCETIYQAA